EEPGAGKRHAGICAGAVQTIFQFSHRLRRHSALGELGGSLVPMGVSSVSIPASEALHGSGLSPSPQSPENCALPTTPPIWRSRLWSPPDAAHRVACVGPQ